MALRQPPLASVHEAADARMTEFGGWEMPVSFEGIRAEHEAVRTSVGLFDVSHMGEVVVSGPDAATLMDRLTTNDVGALGVGDAQYSCILREDGVLVDDTVVYRLGDEEFLFVPNAGHDEEMTGRWCDYALEHRLDVEVENRTDELAMVAVQGPDAVEVVDDAAASSVADIPRFCVREVTVGGADCLVARTGYTGEDGVEILCAADEASALQVAFRDVRHCGLGARDTLRLEAGFLLSGKDFHPDDEPRTPYEANLGFVVAAETEFVGRDAALDAKETADERLVGIELDERGVPRNGCAIVADGTEVGHVTSGTMSPTLDLPIGLGYVTREYADEGTDVGVRIRDRVVDATVVGQRFLERHRD